MKKYWIKDLTSKQAIHAPTREIADKLLSKFHELGLTWSSGFTYLEKDLWGLRTSNTIYIPTKGYYSDISLSENEYEILTIEQLHDFNNYNMETKKHWIKNQGECDLSTEETIYIPSRGTYANIEHLNINETEVSAIDTEDDSTWFKPEGVRMLVWDDEEEFALDRIVIAKLPSNASEPYVFIDKDSELDFKNGRKYQIITSKNAKPLPKITELTMQEIADKFGLNVNEIKIV